MPSAMGRRARVNGPTLSDSLRAGIELVLARLRLDTPATRAKIAASCRSKPAARLDPQQTAVVSRVAYIIPRVGARLPWRADCLVQALAAERWLGCQGITTTLHLGIRKDRATPFEAHAWLTAGDQVVTGGDSANYEPVSRP